MLFAPSLSLIRKFRLFILIQPSIGAAVDVLEGKSERFTKIQALRILVHLVADVHQPFHAVSGYFDCTDAFIPSSSVIRCLL